MKKMTIRGYTDRPSVTPGETIGVHVDVDEEGPFRSRLLRVVNGNVDPRGPGEILEEVGCAITGDHFARPQTTRRGGHVQVDTPPVDGSRGFSLQLFLYPTLPGLGRQVIIGQGLDGSNRGWWLEVTDGHLAFTVGNGSRTVSARSEKPLLPEVWYSVIAIHDPDADTLSLRQVTRVNRTNSRFGLVVDLDSDGACTTGCGLVAAGAAAPIVIAGIATESNADGVKVASCFYGKIDAPKIISGILTHQQAEALSAGAVPEDLPYFARWDFAANGEVHGFASDAVLDVSGNRRHGVCVNTPDRGMTGWNWQGHHEHFAHAKHEYGAIWFHGDSVEDCGWERALSIAIPADLRSGVYALEVSKDGQCDRVVFFVRPRRGKPGAKIAVMMPTFTYTVYGTAISHAEAPAETVLAQVTELLQTDIELVERGRDFGVSGYEYHADGRGCQYTTWRRPILNLRPDYLYPIGTPWNFVSDLHLIAWLEAKGFAYDVITDHDVHAEGKSLLAGYNLVISGTHPEYVSSQILDAWEDYVAEGGRGMYLGGNGWYWVTAQHPTKPYLLEVRRGEAGDQTWKAKPGEYHHGFTGERGGLWRHRARAPQKIFATGYAAHGFSTSAPYYLLPDAVDPRASWIFDGTTDRNRIGTDGLVGGGAVGQEFDRYELALGTPPQSMLLGSSYGHTRYDGLVPEELYSTGPNVNGEEHPLVRGDLVFFTTVSGGAMFAASSMAWAPSLPMNGYDNDVSAVMLNVVRKFSADGPLPHAEWAPQLDEDSRSKAGAARGPWS